MAITLSKQKRSQGDIRARLDKVCAQGDQTIALVTDTLASYERKGLIEQKVPFIVPGNQL